MGVPRLRILAVDDDEASFLLLRRALTKVPDRGFDVEWMRNFEDGLKALTEQRHDVCLLDYQLHPGSGLDLLRKAIALGVKTPIIMLTGTDDPKVDIEAAQIGAADFLEKDHLNPVLLERSIRYALQHACTLNALQKSHERFRLLFERSMDAILIYDEQERFVEVNGAACDLLGFTAERLLQLRWQDLFTNAPLVANPDPGSLNWMSYRRLDGQTRAIEYSVSHLAPKLKLAVLRDVTERANLEREIQQASEREQRRLGQDLHDGLGQTLTGIACLARSLEDQLKAKHVEEAEKAGAIAQLINEALLHTRQLSRGLCPVELERNDLQAALRQLAENMKSLFGVVCQTQLDTKVKITDNAAAVHLYRIAQEASTNAVKHGHAKQIEISLFRSGARLVLRIQDDGKGFSRMPQATGMGLRVMRHRAGAIGAVLGIRSTKKGGTIVTCSLNKTPGGKKEENQTADASLAEEIAIPVKSTAVA